MSNGLPTSTSVHQRGIIGNAHQRGFTLIELSIVLLIIGVLASGVLTGQSLMKQARLHRAVAEFAAIKTSLNVFQTKYNALPGDFVGAEAYWPTGQWAAPWAQAGRLANGDGKWGSGGSAFYEGLWAWQQMARADIIPGPYTDPATSATDENFTFLRPVKNMFSSRISGGGYLLLADKDWLGEEGIDGTLGNYILLADFTNDKSWDAQNLLLSADDARTLDAKMDDGAAFSGTFLSEGSCLGATGDYDSRTSGKCVAMALLDRKFDNVATLAALAPAAGSAAPLTPVAAPTTPPVQVAAVTPPPAAYTPPSPPAQTLVHTPVSPPKKHGGLCHHH